MNNIVWLRRDLRLHDNAAIHQALKHEVPIQFVFIFDKNILDKLDDPKDSRVSFIYYTLLEIKEKLQSFDSDLWMFYGEPEQIWKEITDKHEINHVFYNRDYETSAIERDQAVAKILENKNIELHSYKDHVIFEGDEILKNDGDPYVVFTPYKNKWLERLYSQKDNDQFKYLAAYSSEGIEDKLNKNSKQTYEVSLEDMGFQTPPISLPIKFAPAKLIANYNENRDYPSIDGTSRLGLHFRFGTISIREKASKAIALSDTYLSELIWRDFYSQILQHFPHVEKGPFRKKYERLDWRNNEDEFAAWCEGKTGYPIVDAGMRELNQSGFMHNRVRMVVASFLCKHLLINWQWGEAYFAEKLLDYDLASNNGGWQWAAGCGTDAAPYFRIFNPESQQKKFDKDFKYIKKWVPEWGTDAYPEPIVEHKFARERCLRVYKESLDR